MSETEFERGVRVGRQQVIGEFTARMFPGVTVRVWVPKPKPAKAAKVEPKKKVKTKEYEPELDWDSILGLKPSDEDI